MIGAAYEEVPAFYSVLAERPEFLNLHWERDRAVMTGGELTALERHLIGLGVAATRHANYAVGWQTRRLLALGLGRAEILEAIMVIEAFNKNNKFTAGMLIDLGVWRQRSD